MQETPAGHEEVRLVVTASHSGRSPEAFLLQPLLEGQAGHRGGLSHQVRGPNGSEKGCSRRQSSNMSSCSLK